ncbi:hypothetical protein Tco_0854444 [Tanacetum coccineum]
MIGEPATEAPMNGGRNYNGPKRLDEIDMSVKMRTTCTWTEIPYEASLFPGIGFGLFLRSLGGRRRRPPSGGASQKVTEACKGFLGPDGDWPSSAKAEGSLTARPTHRAGMKVGLSDPTVPSGRAVAQRIKGEGFHAVPPPYTGNYMPSRPDLSFAGFDDSVYKTKVSETITTASKTSKDSLEKPKTVRPSAPIIED